MSEHKILVVCMDLDDTLMPTNFRYHEASWRCGFIITKTLGAKSPRPNEVIKRQLEIDDALFKDHGFQVKRFPLSWVQTYEELAKKAGLAVDPAVSRRIFNTASRFKYGPFQAFLGAKAALRQLQRAGYELHLITAGEDFLQRRKVEQSGLSRYFEPENIHVTTGDKRKEISAVIQGRSGAAVMVGDSKRNDIKAAKELGVVSIWIPSETKSREDPKIIPDHEIGSITKLPALIAKIDAAARSSRRRPRRKRPVSRRR